MSKIFKNMIPYWKSIVIIIALLFVQAWCDLSLPSYTSDIIDVGIQNYGVEHVVPEALTADEFETAELFMTDEEADLWESIYEKDGDIYRLQVTSRSELNEIDDTLAVPLIMNYQMSAMEDSAVKEHVAKPTGADAGTLEKDTLLSMRDSMEETIDTMGSSLVKSMGAAYAVSCDKAAGIDVEKIQKSYLVTAGLKMVGMALMIGIVTVLVGFFASRVGAGIGRTLREKVFKQVVGFSNAEMDKFSKHERYPADPDGFGYAASYGSVCTDLRHWRCVKSRADRSRNGMDHCPCDPCDPWLCDGADGSCHAKVPVDAEAGG